MSKNSETPTFEISGYILPILALAAKLAANCLCGTVIPRDPYFAAATCASYLLAASFIFLNVRYAAFATLGILGCVSNFLVISLNGFYMPVSTKIGISEIPESKQAAYRLADADTRLGWLGDVIHIKIGGFEGLASIGDVLLAAAVVALTISIAAAIARQKKAQ